MRIDYPSQIETAEQKALIMERAFEKTVSRPPLRVVFHNAKLTALVCAIIYLLLVLICSSYSLEHERSGFIALAVFPLTYFAFFFLSLVSEEQSEIIELKRSMKYSFTYLVSLRMFYASLAAVPANLLLLIPLSGSIDAVWSVGAAGVASTLLLALFSVVSYEKTGSVKLAAIVAAVWTVGCIVLTRHGAPLYDLIIKAVPLAVHIVAAAASLAAFITYIGKVEKQNAYGF